MNYNRMTLIIIIIINNNNIKLVIIATHDMFFRAINHYNILVIFYSYLAGYIGIKMFVVEM